MVENDVHDIGVEVQQLLAVSDHWFLGTYWPQWKWSHFKENCVSYLKVGTFWVADMSVKRKYVGFPLFGGESLFQMWSQMFIL